MLVKFICQRAKVLALIRSKIFARNWSAGNDVEILNVRGAIFAGNGELVFSRELFYTDINGI